MAHQDDVYDKAGPPASDISGVASTTQFAERLNREIAKAAMQSVRPPPAPRTVRVRVPVIAFRAR